jgi:hypothetical protein
LFKADKKEKKDSVNPWQNNEVFLRQRPILPIIQMHDDRAVLLLNFSLFFFPDSEWFPEVKENTC